jgi:hypothetical protein
MVGRTRNVRTDKQRHVVSIFGRARSAYSFIGFHAQEQRYSAW